MLWILKGLTYYSNWYLVLYEIVCTKNVAFLGGKEMTKLYWFTTQLWISFSLHVWLWYCSLFLLTMMLVAPDLVYHIGVGITILFLQWHNLQYIHNPVYRHGVPYHTRNTYYHLQDCHFHYYYIHMQCMYSMNNVVTKGGAKISRLFVSRVHAQAWPSLLGRDDGIKFLDVRNRGRYGNCHKRHTRERTIRTIRYQEQISTLLFIGKNKKDNSKNTAFWRWQSDGVESSVCPYDTTLERQTLSIEFVVWLDTLTHTYIRAALGRTRRRCSCCLCVYVSVSRTHESEIFVEQRKSVRSSNTKKGLVA